MNLLPNDPTLAREIELEAQRSARRMFDHIKFNRVGRECYEALPEGSKRYLRQQAGLVQRVQLRDMRCDPNPTPRA